MIDTAQFDWRALAAKSQLFHGMQQETLPMQCASPIPVSLSNHPIPIELDD